MFKALTTIQKTLFGANYLVDFNETKCSCFVAVQQTIYVSRYLKSSTHKNTHLTPENIDWSKILSEFK